MAGVIAWCGMRGIVTLAAALALPDGVHGPFVFPYRDLIVFTAFCVVLGTLVLQGMTVSPLMRALAPGEDRTVEREVRLARVETARAGLAEVDGADSGEEMATLLCRKYQSRLAQAESGMGGETKLTGMLRRAQATERRTLSDLRARGAIGDDAFHRVEEELDWAEVNAETMAQVESEPRRAD